MKRCCGTCRWHEHEHIDDGWVCVNAESRYCTDWTDDSDSCEEREGRKENEQSVSDGAADA